jgi:hypothetical protein
MTDGNIVKRFGVVIVMSGIMSLGLVACGGNDSGDDVTIEATDDSQATNPQTTAPVQDAATPDTVKSEEGIVVFDSGWEAEKTGINDHVTVKAPDSVETVTVDVFENSGPTPTTAREMAEGLQLEASNQGGQGVLEDVEINGETWVRYLFTDENGSGVAYCDNADGSIRKLSWTDCSFQDAVDALSEYDAKSAAGEI